MYQKYNLTAKEVEILRKLSEINRSDYENEMTQLAKSLNDHNGYELALLSLVEKNLIWAASFDTQGVLHWKQMLLTPTGIRVINTILLEEAENTTE